MNSNIYKQTVSRIFGTVLFIGCLFSSQKGNAQLNSASYTINSAGATTCVGASSTGTNFTNWTDFVTYFNTYGISGASTVTVLTDEINASTSSLTLTQHSTKPTTSTNTLTIKSTTTPYKILSWASTYEVLALNGIDYVTIQNLEIRNTGNGSYNGIVRFYGGADYNTLNNLILKFTALTTASTSGSYYVGFAGTQSSSTSTSTTHNGSYNMVQNCTLRCVNTSGSAYNSPGPTFGIISQQGTSYYSSTPSNNTFQYNIIENFYYMGIRIYYTNGDQALYNDISRINGGASAGISSTLLGIYSMYNYGTNRSLKLAGNNIHDLPYSGASESSTSNYISTLYGIYSYYNYGTTTNPVVIDANKINYNRVYSTYYGMYLYYNYVINVSNNTMDDNRVYSSGSCYGYYAYYGNDYNFT